MIATSMNREAWQVRASVDGPIRRVNRNRAGLIWGPPWTPQPYAAPIRTFWLCGETHWVDKLRADSVLTTGSRKTLDRMSPL
jgi:hypothetical protein